MTPQERIQAQINEAKESLKLSTNENTFDTHKLINRLQDNLKKLNKIVWLRGVGKFDRVVDVNFDGYVTTTKAKAIGPDYFEIVETLKRYTEIELLGVTPYPEVEVDF